MKPDLTSGVMPLAVGVALIIVPRLAVGRGMQAIAAATGAGLVGMCAGVFGRHVLRR